MKKLASLSLFVLINILIFYPCQGTEDQEETSLHTLPNEMILSVYERLPEIILKTTYPYKSVNIRNTLALVCHAWHEKAVELTDCISSPTSINLLYMSDGKEYSRGIPKVFTNLTRLNLNNNTVINPSTVEDILSFNLRVLSVTFNNTLNNHLVSQLTTLETLKLVSNLQITDEALKPLTNLERLKLCNQDKVTSGALQNLTNLTKLHLQGPYIITAPSLSLLTKLQKLSLKGGYTWVEEDKDLEIPVLVGVYGLPKINFADLVTLSNLTSLTLEGNIATSRQALTLFEGKLGNSDFTRKEQLIYKRKMGGKGITR